MEKKKILKKYKLQDFERPKKSYKMKKLPELICYMICIIIIGISIISIIRLLYLQSYICGSKNTNNNSICKILI